MVQKISSKSAALRARPAPSSEPLSRHRTNPAPLDQFDRERMGIAAKE